MKKPILVLTGLIALAFALNAQTTIGLVAHYRFDGTFTDATGNTANGGAISGSPYFTCGVENDAVSFNGQTDEVVILGGPVNDEFDSEDVTVAFYFKPRGGAGTQFLLSKRSPNCIGNSEFYITYTPNSRSISAFFFETSDKRTIATHQIDNTACWQHLAIVREGGRVRLYLNGALINVFSTLERVNVANNGDLIFGNSDCRNPTEFPFNGLMDELRVYNRALDEREVRELYTAPDQIVRDANIINIFLGESFDASLTTTCGTAFTWSPLDGVDQPNAPATAITPQQAGEIAYQVAIADTSVATCTAIDEITFNVIDPDDLDCGTIFLPSAFTPNGDGLNDTYGLSNPFAIQQMERFEIFDRWGNLVFATSDPFERWDGFYKGQTVNAGVLRYAIQWSCNGEPQFQSGEIAVLR
ncbi:LamG-like jellyroll fold domain-containing protein [Phaeodactylibacter luteus]|uniref:T9SS type B sorting domain-containing protein n=1 Tax=Phaeodactylibacter luteus TaxID=1564516 RepID=A0A5C6RZ91_9BACT|nr:LamG-like jellyroll fold domain-containing protein [Phaeodactylibacter luteus]TXB67601.1 T9SS type B sorting domain-containing protein [Phaeodactylibacter luteus]